MSLSDGSWSDNLAPKSFWLLPPSHNRGLIISPERTQRTITMTMASSISISQVRWTCLTISTSSFSENLLSLSPSNKCQICPVDSFGWVTYIYAWILYHNNRLPQPYISTFWSTVQSSLILALSWYCYGIWATVYPQVGFALDTLSLNIRAGMKIPIPALVKREV